MYDGVVDGLVLWRDAAAAGKVGRGRLIARKPAVDQRDSTQGIAQEARRCTMEQHDELTRVALRGAR